MTLPPFLRLLSPLEEAQRAKEQVEKQLLWQSLAYIEMKGQIETLKEKQDFLLDWLANK